MHSDLLSELGVLGLVLMSSQLMLNAEEESLNEGIKVKDTIFAMTATASQKSNGSGYN